MRLYTKNDIPTIFNLLKLAFRDHDGVIDPPSSVATKTLNEFHKELSKANAFVVEKKTALIACALFEAKEKTLYVGRLAVHPEFRRQGIATKLIHEVEQHALKKGFETLELAVRVALTNQQSFYKRLGFMVDGYGYHVGFSTPTFIRMTKQLAFLN